MAKQSLFYKECFIEVEIRLDSVQACGFDSHPLFQMVLSFSWVRTAAYHAVDTGSNPVRTAIN